MVAGFASGDERAAEHLAGRGTAGAASCAATGAVEGKPTNTISRLNYWFGRHPYPGGPERDCCWRSACCRRARQVADIDLRRQIRRLRAPASARWRSGNDDRSTAAAHDLAVDENILALVDWDVVTVFVHVRTPTALVVVDRERVGGRRGQGDNSQGADERRCVLEAGQVDLIIGGIPLVGC